MRFDHERNREEFKEIHGFLPAEIAWEPRLRATDRRDNRDPAYIGAQILQRVRRWPSRGVCSHADRVLSA